MTKRRSWVDQPISSEDIGEIIREVKPDVRSILDNSPWRTKEAARKWQVSGMTVWRWMKKGVEREDGQRVYLAHIKGPDGGYRTNQEAYVRFFEELNGGAK